MSNQLPRGRGSTNSSVVLHDSSRLQTEIEIYRARIAELVQHNESLLVERNDLEATVSNLRERLWQEQQLKSKFIRLFDNERVSQIAKQV